MRLLRASGVLFLLFTVLFIHDEFLYTFIARPIVNNFALSNPLIATDVTASFTVPLKLAFHTTLLFLIPYLLFEIWSFIAPGLYLHERRSILPLLLSSVFLFYLGIAFAYFIICPLALNFFTNAAPKNVSVMIDIRHYLEFILSLLLGGGLAFQVPIITYACLKMKLVSTQQLMYLRPYIIVAAFVIGMLLTPPDVISQILLALPMWGLFEIGLWYGRKSEGANGRHPH